jgi:hypothetical protein
MVVSSTNCSQKKIEKLFGPKKGIMYHGTKPEELDFFFKISEIISLRNFWA